MQRTLVNEDTILKKDKSPVTGSFPTILGRTLLVQEPPSPAR